MLFYYSEIDVGASIEKEEPHNEVPLTFDCPNRYSHFK